MSETKKTLSFKKKAMFYFIALMLVFACLEIICRVYINEDVESQCRGTAMLDDELGYIYKPDSSCAVQGIGLFQWHTIRINSRQLRDNDYGKKAPGDFRIVMLGDSFTANLGLPLKKGYPKLLERLYRDGGSRVDVINVSMSGYDPDKEKILLRRFGLPLEPDMVVLAFFVGNDFTQPRNTRFKQMNGIVVVDRPESSDEGNKRNKINRFLKKRFRLLLVVDKAIDIIRQMKGNYPVTISSCYDAAANTTCEASWDYTRRQLDDIVELCRRNNIRLVFMIIPEKAQLYPKLWETLASSARQNGMKNPEIKRLQEIIKEYGSEAGVPVLDLLPVMASHVEKGEKLFISFNSHWNARGNSIAAKELYNFLQPLIGKDLESKNVEK